LKDHLSLPLSDEYYLEGERVEREKVDLLVKTIKQGINANLIPNPVEEYLERETFNRLTSEIQSMLDQNSLQINIETYCIDNYSPLLLSESFTSLLQSSPSTSEPIVGILTNCATKLMSEVITSASLLEEQYIQKVKSILQTALDKKYSTPRECSEALTSKIRSSNLSDDFIKWLKYKIDEEKGRVTKLKESGFYDDEEEEEEDKAWLSVLEIVRDGVYKEFERKYDRYIEPISYIMRLEERGQRYRYLNMVVRDLTDDERGKFKDVVERIVGKVGEEGYEVLGGEVKKILELGEHTEEIFNREGYASLEGSAVDVKQIEGFE